MELLNTLLNMQNSLFRESVQPLFSRFPYHLSFSLQCNMSVVFGWRYSISYAEVGDISSQRGIHYKGDILVKPAQYAGKCYVHPQSGCRLFWYTLRRSSGGCPALCSCENLLTSNCDGARRVVHPAHTQTHATQRLLVVLWQCYT